MASKKQNANFGWNAAIQQLNKMNQSEKTIAQQEPREKYYYVTLDNNACEVWHKDSEGLTLIATTDTAEKADFLVKAANGTLPDYEEVQTPSTEALHVFNEVIAMREPNDWAYYGRVLKAMDVLANRFRKRAAHFEKEFDAANKEVLYLQGCEKEARELYLALTTAVRMLRKKELNEREAKHLEALTSTVGKFMNPLRGQEQGAMPERRAAEAVLLDVDYKLSLLEDYVHGDEGAEISKIRAGITKHFRSTGKPKGE